MKISIASDHAGFDLKNFLVDELRSRGFDVYDQGAHELVADDDYPTYISKVAHDVSKYEEAHHQLHTDDVSIDGAYDDMRDEGIEIDEQKFLTHDTLGLPKERQVGIIIGGSGQGEAMVANKFPYVRATVLYGGVAVGGSEHLLEQIIRLSREHNDANVLSLGARFLSPEEALKMTLLWLNTSFSEDERHVRRIHQIEDIEKEY
jgi:ribose 5-phosphate isomerase B